MATRRMASWFRQVFPAWTMFAAAALSTLACTIIGAVLVQPDLSRWRIAGNVIHWIPTKQSMLLRFPLQGEDERPVRSLPFGQGPAVQVTYRFDTGVTQGSALALLGPRLDGQVRAFVNFAPVKGGAMADGFSPLRPDSRSWLWTIPADHLQPGMNRIDLLVSATSTRAINAPLFLGPRTEIERAAGYGVWLSNLPPWAVLAAPLVAVIANLLAAALRAPTSHLAIAAAFAAIGARFFIGYGTSPPGVTWSLAEPLLAAVATICAGLALHSDGRRTVPRIRIEAGLLWLALVGGMGSVMLALSGAERLMSWSGVAAATLGLGYLVCRLIGAAPSVSTLPSGQKAVAGLVTMLCLISAALALAGVTGLPVPGAAFAHDLTFVAALTLLALWASGLGLLAITRQLGTIFDQAGTILRQRTELRQAAQALEVQSRQSALLEERQRMARDVHDGIGGQLASLIAQVRMRRISMEQVEQALVGGLAELRFLVSSLDAVGVSLADAMASFLDRAQVQAAAAGMTIEWTPADELTIEVRDPQWILNFYRLLQEAVTNAVRHSGGSRIAISAGLSEGRIVARIEDDGRGFEPGTAATGRGLANLQRRARDLGGVLSIGPAASGKGAAIQLDAPLPCQVNRAAR